jgi:trans-aconitate 2-methyltransferase
VPRRGAINWSAKQYISFEDELTRPVRDLLNAVPETDVRSAVDLGCGPGNSTEVLATRFPGAAIRGLDSSPDMVSAARKRLPQLRFDVAAIERWDEPGPFDVILANAVLQWVPDHAALLPRLIRRLAPGGSLAVQMPDNLDQPAHRLMRDLAAAGPWADRLAGATASRTALEGAGWFYSLLRPHCAQVQVWRTTYHHPLSGGAEAIVEWFKGSGLRPFLAALESVEQAAYLDRYRSAVAEAYPALPDDTVLLPFPRLFIVATR